jgi:hypothetical protein
MVQYSPCLFKADIFVFFASLVRFVFESSSLSHERSRATAGPTKFETIPERFGHSAGRNEQKFFASFFQKRSSPFL